MKKSARFWINSVLAILMAIFFCYHAVIGYVSADAVSLIKAVIFLIFFKWDSEDMDEEL